MILEKAAPLFNTKGLEGTSLTDLERATGMTRGALYGHFRDKEELAMEAFDFTVDCMVDALRARLEPVPSCKGKLLALLDFFACYVLQPPVPGGCPLLNVAVEADDHWKVMRGRVTTRILGLVDLISTLLKKGVRAGEFARDIKARELGYTFFCALEGAIMFSRVERSREPMDIVIKHLKNKLDQISCNPNV